MATDIYDNLYPNIRRLYDSQNALALGHAKNIMALDHL